MKRAFEFNKMEPDVQMEPQCRSRSPIFIVGMPRSGTTLLSTILSAHPSITISPETHYLNKWVHSYRKLDLTRPNHFERFWTDLAASERFSYLGIEAEDVRRRVDEASFRGLFTAMLQAYAERLGKRRWGEKTPAHRKHLATLLRWYPTARVIYMIRDPRAVVASLRKTPWGQRFGVDLHALEWDRAVKIWMDWQVDERVLKVRYEDLVRETEAQARRICEFVSEPFERCMIKARSAEDSPIINREGWARKHFESTFRPISTEGIDKWRQRLTDREVSIVEQMTMQSMALCGYEPDTGGLTFSRRVALATSRNIRRLIRRGHRILHGPPDIATNT